MPVRGSSPSRRVLLSCRAEVGCSPRPAGGAADCTPSGRHAQTSFCAWRPLCLSEAGVPRSNLFGRGGSVTPPKQRRWTRWEPWVPVRGRRRGLCPQPCLRHSQTSVASSSAPAGHRHGLGDVRPPEPQTTAPSCTQSKRDKCFTLCNDRAAPNLFGRARDRELIRRRPQGRAAMAAAELSGSPPPSRRKTRPSFA